MPHSMPLVFISGTGTGVGKTVVTSGLARTLAERGVDVGVAKPLESGCEETDDGLLPADATLVRRAARSSDELDDICPYRYRLPLAPAVAARLEHRETTLAEVEKRVISIASRHRTTLVEGAGGLLVPATADGMMIDLAARLRAPVLLAAHTSLGTINHTLLSLEALRHRGLVPLAVVLIGSEGKPGPDEPLNPAEIASFGGVRVLGPLPRIPADEAGRPSAIAAYWQDAFKELADLLG